MQSFIRLVNRFLIYVLLRFPGLTECVRPEQARAMLVQRFGYVARFQWAIGCYAWFDPQQDTTIMLFVYPDETTIGACGSRNPLEVLLNLACCCGFVETWSGGVPTPAEEARMVGRSELVA